MSVNSFYCYNDFYQCNSNCNGFIIIVKNNVGEISATSDFYIPVGNPNVYDILAVINAVLKPANVLSCSYDNTKINLHIRDYYHKQIQIIHYILMH